MAFFHTVEFYVILAFVAAAVIAFCGRPAQKGPARTILIAGDLLVSDPAAGCGVAVRVDDRNRLEVFRYGLRGVTDKGAYSLAVEIVGFDVTIKERTVAGNGTESAECGLALIDGLGEERYHFRYVVEDSALSTAFYLTMRPGARADRPLEA